MLALPIQHVAKGLCNGVGGVGPAVLPRALDPTSNHLSAAAFVAQDRQERTHELSRRKGIKESAGAAEHLRKRATVARHDWRAALHRFQNGEAEPLVEGRKHQRL